MIGNVSCAICETSLRKDIADLDAKWEYVKEKYVCRECAKEIALLVLEEY